MPRGLTVVELVLGWIEVEVVRQSVDHEVGQQAEDAGDEDDMAVGRLGEELRSGHQDDPARRWSTPGRDARPARAASIQLIQVRSFG